MSTASQRQSDGRQGAAVILVDLGGTNARFARWSGHGEPHVAAKLPNDRFASFDDALRHFLAAGGDPADPATRPPVGGVRALAIAAASAVRQAPVRLTNRDWTLDPAALRAAFGLDEVIIVNDFAAVAAGLAEPPAAARVLQPAPASEARARLVLGPGTGLGCASLLRRPGGWLVLPGEGGHIGASWQDAGSDAIGAAVRQRLGLQRVSWERVVSGPGLSVLHAELSGRDAAAPMLAPEAVVAAARAGDAAAVRTTELFSALLGAFAGDLCLANVAVSELYLYGGVVPAMGPLFRDDLFLQAFRAKGRFAALLDGVGVAMLDDPDVPLRGLARLLDGRAQLAGPLLRAA